VSYRASERALSARAFDVDMNPLPVAGAGGELIDFRLIDRDPLGRAKILTDMILDIGEGDFCHREPVPDR
jgi:hypothetical protein